MKQEDFDNMRESISIDYFSNRTDGFARFKRAFWYGSTGMLGGYFSDGKGFRKTLRNAPKNIMKRGVVNILASPVKVVMAPISVVPVVGSTISGMLSTLFVAPLELGFDKFISEAKGIYRMKIEDESSYKNDLKAFIRKRLKKGERTEEEEIRKKIKEDLKELSAANFLVTIDRNLVKMKDAQHKIIPATKEMEKFIGYEKSSFDGLEEMKIDAIHGVLVALIETEYYASKITTLVNTMQDALTKMKSGLDEFGKKMDAVDVSIEKYIVEKM